MGIQRVSLVNIRVLLVADSIRDLYELLMQKEALEERLGAHQMVRKAGRSPSLRLRFGRRSDPSMLPVSYYSILNKMYFNFFLSP